MYYTISTNFNTFNITFIYWYLFLKFMFYLFKTHSHVLSPDYKCTAKQKYFEWERTEKATATAKPTFSFLCGEHFVS